MTSSRRRALAAEHRERINRYLCDAVPVSGGSVGIAGAEIAHAQAIDSATTRSLYRAYKGYRIATPAGGFGNSGVASSPNISSPQAQGNVNPSATDGPMAQYKTLSTASLVCAGIYESSGANDGLPVSRIETMIARVRIDQVVNARYWIGMCKNSATPTSAFSSQTPGTPFIGFHYNNVAFTDGTFRGCTIDDTGSNITFVTTGFAPTSSTSTLFTWTTSPTGTQINFFINGTQVAVSTANIPTTTPLVLMALCDNLDLANTISITFSYQYAAML